MDKQNIIVGEDVGRQKRGRRQGGHLEQQGRGQIPAAGKDKPFTPFCDPNSAEKTGLCCMCIIRSKKGKWASAKGMP